MNPLPRLPAYALNGITVAFGIAFIQWLFGTFAGAHAAQWAVSGAVCASLADVPNTAPRTWRRVSAAAVLSIAAATVVALLKPYPLALGGGVVAIAFVAMMTMAWGPRAGAVSFAPILSLVFTMAVPAAGEPSLAGHLGWFAAGSAAYLAWSLASGWALQRRYRTLALAGTLHALAQLLRSRAALLESQALRAEGADAPAMQAWIQGEAQLADRLQAARDFLFAAPDGSADTRRETAILLRAIELRDVLLASRLDLDLLGGDAAGRWILQRVAQALRQCGLALDAAADSLRDGRPAPLPGGLLGDAPERLLFADAPVPIPDVRQRLLPALTGRLRSIAADVARIHALLHGAQEAAPLTRQQLQRFVAPEGWPLAALKAQMSFASPVLRHALRASAALGSAYFIALALPWASHPHWLVLSVAVVLRGNLEQTLSRRNARVIGTMAGCAVVLLLSHGASAAALQLVFLAAVGTAHSFVLQRYWLTAGAATVMALLQSHMVAPEAGFAIAERVADTFLGAGLAWAFSYVLPSWERRNLPRAIDGVLRSLRAFAGHALSVKPAADTVALRLARRHAYDALGGLVAGLQRSSAEPQGVRLPMREVAMLLDHGQRLMAHLSMVRLTLAGRGAELASPAAENALREAGVALASSLSLKPVQSDDTGQEEIDAEALSRLPHEAPGENILPWLERRLQLLALDGRRIRGAAQQALAKVS